MTSLPESTGIKWLSHRSPISSPLYKSTSRSVYIYAVVIEDCLNDSNINSDSSFVGGITGGINSGNNDTVKRCYNKGHISASDYVGGIVGGRLSGYSGWYYIYDCYNTGSVSGNSGVGGILGHNYAGWAHEIKNCYNFGPIKANNN